MEFTRPGSAYLVPYNLVRVGPGQDPYPSDALWAEPDSEEAARIMQAVVADPEAAAAVGARARTLMQRDHSVTARSKLLASNLSRASSSATRSVDRAPNAARLLLERQTRRGIGLPGRAFDRLVRPIGRGLRATDKN